MPSAPWIVACGPEHLEQARHDVDLDVEPVELADDRRALAVCGACEKATITRSTSSCADELRQLADLCRGR